MEASLMPDLKRLTLTDAQQDALALYAVERADMRTVLDIYAGLVGVRCPSLVTDVYLAEGANRQHCLCYTIRFMDSQPAPPRNYYGGTLIHTTEFNVDSALEWVQRGIHRDKGIWTATVERHIDGGS